MTDKVRAPRNRTLSLNLAEKAQLEASCSVWMRQNP
jgi:hypothetical protein